MIISSHDWMQEVEFDAHMDSATIRNVQDTDKIKEYVQKVGRETDRGFSADRSQQYIGTVPNSIIIKYGLRTPKQIMDFLEKTEEGAQYRIPGYGRKTHAGIIVK